jgi:hypothetical protein
MRTAGITMVRDEADVIAATIRHMAREVDFLFVADNRSVDGTSDLLEDLRREVRVPMLVGRDNVVGYQQSHKMSALARIAHEMVGAEWIVPFDADEIWYCSPSIPISDYLEAVPDDVDIVEARLFDHVCSGADDPDEPDPVKRIQWRRHQPAILPKVACRFRPGLVIEMGNHGARYEDREAVTWDRMLAIRHFPYRSVEQIVRKIRNGAEAYAATDLPEHFGAHWRQWGRILDSHGEEAIADLFHTWHFRDDPTRGVDIEGEIQGPLIFDPAPVRR